MNERSKIKFTDYINFIRKKKNYENNNLIKNYNEINSFNLKNSSYISNNLNHYIKNLCKCKMDMKDKKKSIYFYKDRQEESIEISSQENNLNIYQKSNEFSYGFNNQNINKGNFLKKKSTLYDNSSKNSFFYEIENSEKSQNDYSNFENEKEKNNLSRKSFYSIYDYTDENDESDYQIIKKNKKNNILHEKGCNTCYNDNVLEDVYDDNYYMHIYDTDNLKSNNLITKSSNKNINKNKNKDANINRNKYFNRKKYNRKKKIRKELINKIDYLVKCYKIYNAKVKFHYVGIITILKKYIYVIKNNNILFFKKKLNNKKIPLISKIKKKYDSCCTFYFIQKKYLYNIETKHKRNRCSFLRYLYLCKLKKKLQNYYRHRKLERKFFFKNLMKLINSQIKKNYFFNEYIDCGLKDEFNKNKSIINKKHSSNEHAIKKYLMYCFQNNTHFRESLDNEKSCKKISKYKKYTNNENKNYEKKKKDIKKKKKESCIDLETKMKDMYKKEKNIKQNSITKNVCDNKKEKEKFDICVDCGQLYMNFVKEANHFNNFKNGKLSSDINIIKKVILSKKGKNENYIDNDKGSNNNINTINCKNSSNEKKNDIYDNIKKRNNSKNRNIIKNYNNNKNKNDIDKVNNNVTKKITVHNVENVNNDDNKNFNSDSSKNINNDNIKNLNNENNKITKNDNSESIISISTEEVSANIIENEEISNSYSEKINNDKNEDMNNNSNENVHNDNIKNMSTNNLKEINNNNISNEKECTYMNKNEEHITLEKSLKNEMTDEIYNFSTNDQIDKTKNYKKYDLTYENEEKCKSNQKDTHTIINYETEIEAKMEIEIKKSLEEIISSYINNDIINQDTELNNIDQINIEEKNDKEKDIQINGDREIILNNSFSLNTHEQSNLDGNSKVESISNFFHSFKKLNSEYINIESKKKKKKKNVKKKKHQREVENIVRKVETNGNCNNNFKTSSDIYNFYFLLQSQILDEFKKGYLKKMKKIFNKKCKKIEKDISENLKTIVNIFNNVDHINDAHIHICKKKKENSQENNFKNEIKVNCKDKKLRNNKAKTQIINDKNSCISSIDNNYMYINEPKSENDNNQYCDSKYNHNDFIENNAITYINNSCDTLDNIYKNDCNIKNSDTEYIKWKRIHKKQQNEEIHITNILDTIKKNIYKKQSSLNSKKDDENKNGEVKLNILRSNSLIDLKQNSIFKNLNYPKFCNSIKNDIYNKINALKYLNIIKQKSVSDIILKKINAIGSQHRKWNKKINDKNYVKEFIQHIKKKNIDKMKLYNSVKEIKKSLNKIIKTERKKKRKKVKNLFRKLELYKKKDIIKISKLKINKKIHYINSYNNIYYKFKKQLSESKLSDVIFSKFIKSLNNVKKNEIINNTKYHLNEKIKNEINSNIKKAPVYIYRIKHQNKYKPIKNFKYSFLFIKKPIYHPLIRYKFIPYYYYDYRSRNKGYILNSPLDINKIRKLNYNKEKNENFISNYTSNNNYNMNYDNNNNNITNFMNNKISFISKGFDNKNISNNINDYYISLDKAYTTQNNYHSNFNNTYRTLSDNEDICVNKKYDWRHLGRRIYAKGKIYINRNNHIINKYNKQYKYQIISINNKMRNIRYNFFIYDIFKKIFKLSKNVNHKRRNLVEISNMRYNDNSNEKNKYEILNNFDIQKKIENNNTSLINYSLNNNIEKMKYLYVKNTNNLYFFEIVQNKKNEINNENNINDIKSYDNISTFYLNKNLYKDTILKKKDNFFDTINYNIKNIPKDNRNNIELQLNNYYKINEEMLPNSNNLSMHKTCSKNCILKNTYGAYNNMNNLYNTTINHINKNNLTKCHLKVKKIYFNNTNETSQIKDSNLKNTSLQNTLKDNYFYDINNTNLTNVTLKNKNIESFQICSINSLKNEHIKNTNYKHHIENICIYKDF
ncbi:conserved Plasmodium protein, unknown function [Plasmodium relictum]|uniref:Uncharacterized protein n=1 Tax=Plasmodium relictum TaxID=85471 RepID=A0A1J1HDD7_PLARL|nr:conserved Plasmodium protein, unknown function [Plasmodium relictum]CRH03790.1 conserved Plasmodium protein, unknown function [Plasmodium relictum]